jgi:23S rRNA pseudouridine2605 synthase
VTDPDAGSEPQRLQKVLAHAGIASRRAVEEMIEAGRIRVNGERARLGQRVDPDKDEVEIDGSRVPLRADLRYFLLNKPVGVVSTASDPEGRPTVLDVIDREERVWPVGRLDIDSEGALLLTNDGELTHRLTHPSFEVAKVYVVEVRGAVGPKVIRALLKGVELDDGPARVAKAHILEQTRGDTLIEIVLTEGRNRVIRRMLEELGFAVVALVRVAIGPLRLGRLKSGSYRTLGPAEVGELYRAVGL